MEKDTKSQERRGSTSLREKKSNEKKMGNTRVKKGEVQRASEKRNPIKRKWDIQKGEVRRASAERHPIKRKWEIQRVKKGEVRRASERESRNKSDGRNEKGTTLLSMVNTKKIRCTRDTDSEVRRTSEKRRAE